MSEKHIQQEAIRSFLARDVLIIIARSDPVPDVDISLNDVDCPILHRDRDGTTPFSVAALVVVIKRVKSERWVVRGLPKLLECTFGKFLDVLRKGSEHLFEFTRSHIAANFLDSIPLSLRVHEHRVHHLGELPMGNRRKIPYQASSFFALHLQRFEIDPLLRQRIP